MAAGYSDQYWAHFAQQYAELAKNDPSPNREVAELLDIPYPSVGTKVSRARKKGMLTPAGDPRGIQITAKAKLILEGMEHRANSVIAFEAPIYANTKAEAIAEAWDVVTQLESWDPSKGPFVFQPERLRNLGRQVAED